MEEFHSLLILMAVVWVMGKVFRTFSLPMIFGELVGGIIVGPFVLGVVDPDSVTIKLLADLGVFFLMLHAGLEADPHESENLAGDPAYERVRADLSKALADWMHDTDDPLLRGPIPSPFYLKAVVDLGT